MEKLKAELAKLETQLHDPLFFSKDPKKFEASSRRFKLATDELASAEEQWLQLEILREELAAR